MIVGTTLFSGIGTPELACRDINWVLASEIEKFPRAVLEYRFGCHDLRKSGFDGKHALWGDVTALKVRHFRRFGIPLPNVIVAGSPCQSFSIAGLRKGLSDDRGNLTMEFLKLVHSLRNAGSLRNLVWENVDGILSHKDNPFGCFLAGLIGADDPLPPPGGKSWPRVGMVSGPYGRAAWRVFDAQYFGVAQRRNRVFVVADLGNGADPATILFERQGVCGDTPPSRQSREDIAPTIASRTRGGGGLGTDAELDGGLTAVCYGGGNVSGQRSVAAALASHGQRLDFEVETFVVDSNHGGYRRGRPTLRAKGADAGGGSEALVTHGVVHALRGEGFDASEDGTGRGVPIVPVAVAPTVRAGGNSTGGDRPYGTDVDTADSLIPVAYSIQERAVSENPNAGPQGKGVQEEIAYTLEARNKTQAVVHGLLPPIPFDTTQITSKANRSNPQPGEPDHPVAATAHPPAIAFSMRGREGGAVPEVEDGGVAPVVRPAQGGSSQTFIAFSSKDHGADASEDVSPTIRAGGHKDSHANAGTPPAVAFHARQDPDCGPVTHPLDTDGYSIGDTDAVWRVRRLTVLECERLQGLPEFHTLIPWRGKRKGDDLAESIEYLKSHGFSDEGAEELAHCPDGNRYKAIGNGMCLNVVAWILKRLVEAMPESADGS